MQEKADKKDESNRFWADRHWSSLMVPGADGGFDYETNTAIDVDARGVQFFLGTYYPKVVSDKAATMYLSSFADKDGAKLQGGKTYRLRVPANVPARQFWSLTIYDHATWAFIYTPQMLVGLSSFDKGKLKMNSDGSVDLYVGPKAPAGLESNWIPTGGKRPFPMFRFYGPEAAFWDKSFVLPDFELVP